MNRKARMPGFSAERVLEVTTQQRSYTGDWTGSSDQQAVTPQNEFGCGLALGAIIGGFIIGQPGVVFGGLWALHRFCEAD